MEKSYYVIIFSHTKKDFDKEENEEEQKMHY